MIIVEGSPEDGRLLQGRSVWCTDGIDSCFGQLRAATGHGFRIGCTLVDASQGKEAGARNRSPDLLVRLFVLLEA